MKSLKTKKWFGASVLLIALAIVSITSCTNDEPQQVVSSSQEITDENVQFNEFLQSVDSIKAMYSLQIATRGDDDDDDEGDGSTFAVALADAAGGCIASYIGKRLGGSKKKWWTWGSSTASAIASELFEFQAGVGSNTTVLFREDLNISSMIYDEELSDSLGYYHNCIMVGVSQNGDKYVGDGYVNTGLIYDDVVEYSKGLGLYSPEFDDSELKTELLSSVKEICDASGQYKDGLISKEDLVARQTAILKNRYNASDLDIEIYRKFVVTETAYCAKLDEELLHKYAKDLNGAIYDSELPIEKKGDISSVSQIIINSTLCWQQ